MSTPSDVRLLAWLAGALEPGDALVVQEAVSADPALAARAAQLRSRLDPPAAAAPRRAAARSWRVPPPRVAGGRAGLSIRRAPTATMSTEPESVRAGERFRLRIAPIDRPDDRLLVVLYRGGADWEVVFPAAPEEAVDLSVLPAEPDGARNLDLVARADPQQRWAVALPLRADAAPDWAAAPDARWAALQDALRSGAAPIASATVTLSN